jgi:hypothetical protein
MIRITKGTSQSVYLTLTEKTTLTNPYFLFEFISNDTGNKTYVTCNDFSDNTERFNRFTFSSSLGVGATAGGFDLDGGTYDYQIWETQYANNLIVGSATGIVEIGLMQVVGTLSSTDQTWTANDGDTEYVFE